MPHNSTPDAAPLRATPGQLRRLTFASFLEATTLIVLVFVAVPLKHVAGLPVASSIVGPLHGIAFLFYLWTLFDVVSEGGWTRGEIARLVTAAFVPFGGFFNLSLLSRKRDLAHILRPGECETLLATDRIETIRHGNDEGAPLQWASQNFDESAALRAGRTRHPRPAAQHIERPTGE